MNTCLNPIMDNLTKTSLYLMFRINGIIQYLFCSNKILVDIKYMRNHSIKSIELYSLMCLAITKQKSEL